MISTSVREKLMGPQGCARSASSAAIKPSMSPVTIPSKSFVARAHKPSRCCKSVPPLRENLLAPASSITCCNFAATTVEAISQASLPLRPIPNSFSAWATHESKTRIERGSLLFGLSSASLPARSDRTLSSASFVPSIKLPFQALRHFVGKQALVPTAFYRLTHEVGRDIRDDALFDGAWQSDDGYSMPPGSLLGVQSLMMEHVPFAARFRDTAAPAHRHIYLGWIDVAHAVRIERSLMAENCFGRAGPKNRAHESAVLRLWNLRHAI